MWKQIGKLLKKLVIICLPIIILFQVICAAFPMYYLDNEYAMYKQQKDYISENNDYNRVLILGDSRAKASFMPSQLGEDVYNISLGGISPVESYYMLTEYLENHQAPEYLVLAYAPMHLCEASDENDNFVLWKRCIYFHTFNDKDFFDLAKNSKNFENTYLVDRDHLYLEYFMHKIYFPTKYAVALQKAMFSNRHQVNVEKYNQMIEQKGYSLFGTSGENGGVNGEAKLNDFKASDLSDYYLNAIFALCREKNIQVVLEQLPMTETSYIIIKDDFYLHYDMYLADLQAKNTDVRISRAVQYFDNSLFGDSDHLNTDGAVAFCQMMRDRYPDVFH